MTTADGVPACLLAVAPVLQPPHLEGDPSLATEILPGPPPLASVQQVGLPRKDHKKFGQVISYLPISDPGTTYGAYTISTMAAATTEVDGPRRKRARLDKGCVVSPHLTHILCSYMSLLSCYASYVRPMLHKYYAGRPYLTYTSSLP